LHIFFLFQWLEYVDEISQTGVAKKGSESKPEGRNGKALNDTARRCRE
jgi:hypothetical protein